MASNQNINITDRKVYTLNVQLCGDADAPNVVCKSTPVMVSSLDISGRIYTGTSGGNSIVNTLVLAPFDPQPCLSDVGEGTNKYTVVTEKFSFLDVIRPTPGNYRVTIPYGLDPKVINFDDWSLTYGFSQYRTGDGSWCPFARRYYYEVYSTEGTFKASLVSGYINVLVTPRNPDQPPDPPVSCTVSVT